MGGITISGPKSSSGRHGRSRGRRLRQRAFGLQLTSLMDVLMIIVVFLLKSYGISSMGISQEDKLQLPVSRAPDTFGEGARLVISRDKITLESEVVLQFAGEEKANPFQIPANAMIENAPERGIIPLYDALKKKKDDFELLASRSPNPQEAMKKWTGDILVQADKDASYELLRKVMYTAGLAGYKQFRLAVEKQPE